MSNFCSCDKILVGEKCIFTYLISGMGFVALQSLQYTGYIQVDHGKLKKDMENFLDLDKDGDVDQDDAKLAYNKIFKIMSYNLPAGSGFGVGFIGGLRSG